MAPGHATARITGIQIVDGATASDGALHVTAIQRRRDDGLGILECRPYTFLTAT